MMEGNNRIKRKDKILKISAICGALLIVFGISYALFTVTLTGKKKVKVQTGGLDVQIKNESVDGINLVDALPESDEDGANETPYEFDLVNNSKTKVNYDLYLMVSNNSDMHPNNLKYNLSVGNTVLANSKSLYETYEFLYTNNTNVEPTSSNKKYSIRRLGTAWSGIGGYSSIQPIEYYVGSINSTDVKSYYLGYSEDTQMYEVHETGDVLGFNNISYLPFDTQTVDEKEYQLVEYKIDGIQKTGWVLKQYVASYYKAYRIPAEESYLELMKLDSASLTAGETKHYSLQMWVNLYASNEAMNKTFEANAFVYAEQAVQ